MHPKATILTTDEVRKICLETMLRALTEHDRQKVIKQLRHHHQDMKDQIRVAEAGETQGKHSVYAEFAVQAFEYELSNPLNEGANGSPPDLPEDVLGIFQEARAHLEVDLSEFQPSRPGRCVRSPANQNSSPETILAEPPSPRELVPDDRLAMIVKDIEQAPPGEIDIKTQAILWTYAHELFGELLARRKAMDLNAPAQPFRHKVSKTLAQRLAFLRGWSNG